MDKLVKIVLALSAVDKMSAVVGSAVRKSTGALDKIEKSKAFKAFDDVGDKALLAGATMAAGFAIAFNAAEESEVATRRLNQVYKSMGETTGKAAKASAEYASKLQFQIGVEDEAIMAVQAKLATFEKVIKNQTGSSEIYERATKAAFDMQAAGFGEGAQNAVQLGKALQDPIKGINALRKSGISFSEGEKAKIKLLVETGRSFEAQQMIMKAIEKQVGGVAAATVTETQKMKIGFGELAETVGKRLAPNINLAITRVGEIVQKFDAFIQANPKLIDGVAQFTIGLLAFGATIKVVTTAVKIFNAISALNPWVALAAGLVAVSYLIYKNWGAISEWFKNLWARIKSMFATAVNFLKVVIMNFTPIGWFVKLWKPLSGLFSAVWGLVKAVFGAAIGALKYTLLNFTPLGLIYKHWSSITTFFYNIWESVKKPFLGILRFVFNLGKMFYNAGANIITSIINGITSKVTELTNKVENVAKKIRDYFPFSPAKTGALKDIHRVKIVETIAQTMKPAPMLKAIGVVTQATRDAFSARAFSGGATGAAGNPSAGGVRGSMSVTFAPVINANGGDAKSIVEELRKLKPEFLKMIKDEMDRDARKKY